MIIDRSFYSLAGRALFAAMIALLVAGCGGSGSSGLGLSEDEEDGSGQPGGGSVAGSMRVLNALPPGNSGHFSADGQAAGSASGNPADFGENIDDQRFMYWRSEWKPGEFQDISGRSPDFQPRNGVRIYLDEFGVPAVYAEETFDLWFGACYIMAVQRLFLLDGVRRQARGTLAELTGPGTVPQDIQTRVLTYSEAEYQQMFSALSQTARNAANGCVDGANQRIAEVNANPSLLPAEYSVLTSQPQPISVTDILAAGVLMTRFVAAEGGNEMENVIALQDLVAMHGATDGRAIFQDVLWQSDQKAAVTIPSAEADFSNITTPPALRQNVFDSQATWALGVPPELLTGPGTGDAPVPAGLPIRTTGPATASRNTPNPAALAAAAFSDFLGNLHGGSFMVAVHGSKTANGHPILINGPQLGYSYPSLLYEIEVHGAGFHARGATVPGLPVVGIGYGNRIAWGVTTGESKTIDSFIEDTSVGSGPNQYLHDGQVKDMDCRTETVFYRQAPGGVPAGPPVFSVNQEVCRTVHGPVVARTADGNTARSVQYAMWMREVETIEGVIDWQRADNLGEFLQGMRKVTWNENTMYADADGNIAYFHPGLHPRRHQSTDQRFPMRGTGEQDHQGFLSFEETPQIINPAQGYVANWNNKPAAGWGDAVGGNALSEPMGPHRRIVNWFELMDSASDITLEDMIEFDRIAGATDPRGRAFVPLVATALSAGGLPANDAALAQQIVDWDQLHYNPAIDLNDENALDRPGETIFEAFFDALLLELFDGVLPASFFARMEAVGNHEYDVPPLANLALRILDPSSSSIAIRYANWKGGRNNNQIIGDALARARAALETEYGSTNPDDFRRVHHRDNVCSLTGGIVGPCTTMPHQDRGSWNELIGFED